jgi:hypothetical protein
MIKKMICQKCGAIIVSEEKHETTIRNRIMIFGEDGTPYAICKGYMGTGHPCKSRVELPKELILDLMKEHNTLNV